mmetsp:Transcript_16591/g.35900  ORF Transcript_16591/g.35900 Transcript_16591/m.35900 type:complete len:128 (-) Transcript_16591:1299-1682(-)
MHTSHILIYTHTEHQPPAPCTALCTVLRPCHCILHYIHFHMIFVCTCVRVCMRVWVCVGACVCAHTRVCMCVPHILHHILHLVLLCPMHSVSSKLPHGHTTCNAIPLLMLLLMPVMQQRVSGGLGPP